MKPSERNWALGVAVAGVAIAVGVWLKTPPPLSWYERMMTRAICYFVIVLQAVPIAGFEVVERVPTPIAKLGTGTRVALKIWFVAAVASVLLGLLNLIDLFHWWD